MSERGSFVTQYMYCDTCFIRMKEVLCKSEKYLYGRVVETSNRKTEMPIIAGKIGGIYGGQELCDFQYKTFNKKNAPCHSVVVAVIPDDSTDVMSAMSSMPQFFIVLPDGNVEDYADYKDMINEAKS